MPHGIENNGSDRHPAFFLIVARWCGIVAALCTGACDFPYSPKPEKQPGSFRADSVDRRSFAGTGTVYRINGAEQSCNPSIAPSGPFSGCMLFLGFERLSLEVPETMTGFETPVAQHDRLVIADTSNTVRWFVMLDRFAGAGELQCPEWSTHPGYLACLAGKIEKPYSGYAVRVADGAVMKLCDGTLEEFSTPHFWIPDSAGRGGQAGEPSYGETGFADFESVSRFFGTTRFKFVYTLPSSAGSLFYIDYSDGSSPRPVRLAKPEGREHWYCASPLVSPDGGWVAFHCFYDAAHGEAYSSYIQRLTPGSIPRLVAEGGSDPHWWTDPFSGDYHIVYTVTTGEYYTSGSFGEAGSPADESSGYTLKRRLSGTWNPAPSHTATLETDDADTPDTLIRFPFKGGLSRDGYFLATAYKYAFIGRLEDDR